MEDVSLAVMRIQPLHKGHQILIGRMLQAPRKALIAIGSTQEAGTEKNPFSYEQRCEMLRMIFNNSVQTIALVDIGASTKQEWAQYVIKEARKNGYNPVEYYAGSPEDASWFSGALATNIVDRATVGLGINATQIRKDIFGSPFVADEIKAYIRRLA